MKNLLISLIIVTISLNSFSQVVSLNKDDKAPYAGLLFTKEKADELRKELLDKDSLTAENQSLGKQIDLYKRKEDISTNQINELLDANTKLSSHIKDQNSEYRPLLWFVIGVATSTLTVYAIKKASQ